MERKKLICIGCPKGCELTVFLDGKQVTKVEGNHCKKGAVYGVDIIVEDSLQDKRFYGVFKVQGNTIKDVLDAMASTNQMKYRYEHGKYILY